MIQEQEYRGFKIEITGTWKFKISSDEDDAKSITTYHDSLNEAKQAINLYHTAKEKQNSITIRIALHTRTNTGAEIIVRGINANTGALLTTNKGYEGDIFPDVPWIIEKLKELTFINQRQKELSGMLKKYTINNRRAYGRIDPNNLEVKINELQVEVATKTTAAKEAANFTESNIVSIKGDVS